MDYQTNNTTIEQGVYTDNSTGVYTDMEIIQRLVGIADEFGANTDVIHALSDDRQVTHEIILDLIDVISDTVQSIDESLHFGSHPDYSGVYGIWELDDNNSTDNNSTVDIWDSRRNVWTFVSIEDLADDGRWNYIVSLMDYDTIEQVNDEIAPCTRIEFLRRYTEIVGDDEMVAIYCY